MRILNIAEKPSVARSISAVLSQNVTTRRGIHQYCPNICFSHGSEMVFTSVLGHLFSTDFENRSRWNDVDPETLFSERIVRHVQQDFAKIKENIEREALRADMVVIWTDCDREGENIGRQIRDVVQGVRDVEVRRARFSGITRGEVENALRSLDSINEAEADAVDARMELDLRIGSAFTRLQTLAVAAQGKVLSFGLCQIPTLGFVVERARERERFVEEDFWTLRLRAVKDGIENVFGWTRGNVFDRNCVVHFYNSLAGGRAMIRDRKVSEKTKYRPLPLRTVELQKTCASYFKMSGHKVMDVAEALYNKGYISYPRTETDVFAKDFDFRGTLGRIGGDGQVGEYARRLVNGFRQPRSGKNNDMAHSPIYPLKEGGGLSGHDRNVYEFVCRRFLGCLSDDAKGLETQYRLGIRNEEFELKGIKVLEKNYLEIYHYDRWEDKEVSAFALDEIVDGELCIDEGKTVPPGYLTEAELIDLMDKNGIGTDATIHEHILKIQERKYAVKTGNEIRPLRLGSALVDAYESLGLEVYRPSLRKDLEMNLKRISKSEAARDAVVHREIGVYKGLYGILKSNIDRFVETVRNGLEEHVPDSGSRGQKSRRQEKREPERTKDCEVLSAVGRAMPREDVMCSCRLAAKTNENKAGKRYYCCHWVPKRCLFFQWEEGGELQCFCGFEPQILVANTESNKGRRFYKCKKAFRPCKFFQWET